jgi:hypothetical protein
LEENAAMSSNIGWRWVAQLACLWRVVSAELLFGIDSLVSCTTYFSTPYRHPEGIVVRAQYLEPDNRYLCNDNFDAFWYRHRPASPYGAEDESNQDDTYYFGVVAQSGNCSLQQKAEMLELMAEQHSVAVRFLILIDDESSTMTRGVLAGDYNSSTGPCTSSMQACGNRSAGNSSLSDSSSVTMLSVSHECGYLLMEYMSEQANYTRANGGASLFLLSDDPPEAGKSKLRNTLQLVALVVFSFAGSFLLAHVTFSYCGRSRSRRRRRRGAGIESQVQLCLLSEACVEQFQSEEATLRFFAQYKCSTNSSNHSSTDIRSNDVIDPANSDEDHHQPTCAVCLEVLTMHSKVAVLPCDHGFHFECIAPWLTRRQASCPLCKLVLHDPTRHDTSVEESAITAGGSSRTVEEGGGTLGGSSIGDENSITATTADTPDLSVTEAFRPAQQNRWWNRLWRSPRGSPREASVAASSDLMLDVDIEPGSNSVVPSVGLQSLPSVATNAAEME